MKNRIKSWWLRNVSSRRKVKVPFDKTEGELELLKEYDFNGPLVETGSIDLEKFNRFIYVGKGLFISTSEYRDKRYWVHTINEAKDSKKETGKRSRFVNIRSFFHLGNQEVCVEFYSSWPSNFGFEIGWGGDYDLQIRFWFIFNWFIGVQRLPKKFMDRFRNRLPQYEYGREFAISFHNYTVWWRFWVDPDSWNSKIPRWKHGDFSFIDFIRGTSKYHNEITGFRENKIFLREGSYDLVSVRNMSGHKFPRFGFIFNKSWVRYDIVAGKFSKVKSIGDLDMFRYALIKDTTKSKDIEVRDLKIISIKEVDVRSGKVKSDCGNEYDWRMVHSVVKEVPVPIPGKGTTSYNCGETATSSMSTMARHYNDSYSKFYSSVMETRERHGGYNWEPEKNN